MIAPPSANSSPPANGHANGHDAIVTGGFDRFTEKLQLLIDAKECARACSVSPATWWRWDAAGAVPKPVRIGGTTRWKVRDLQRWTAWGCPHRAVFEEFVRAEDET